MNDLHLLRIQYVFPVRGRGVFIIPLLPSPIEGKFRSFRASVVVRKTDGTEGKFPAEFQVECMYGAWGCRWTIICKLATASKADIREAGELLVDEQTFALLERATAAETK